MGAIFIMIALGGFTRLTESGLSIMSWEPFKGAVPPTSEVEWQNYFEKYKTIAEYQIQNKGMSLQEFKDIFWLEYIHRLWGRIIGALFALPLIYFIFKRVITLKQAKKFLVIFLLGAAQGAIGWFMVASGFNKLTDVSQHRLAIHLGLAFLLLGAIYWTALDFKFNKPISGEPTKLMKKAKLILTLVFVQVIFGAYMAGTDAGFTYNTFPLMDGKLIPSGLYVLDPVWKNHFENVAMIQFQHRVMAYVLAVMIIILSVKLVQADSNNKKLAFGFIGVLGLQIVLGIATLYLFQDYNNYRFESLGYKNALHIPVIIAVLHQLNAAVLYLFSIKTCHKLLRN